VKAFENAKRKTSFSENINQIIIEYMGLIESLKDHNKRENKLMEMISLILSEVNKIVKEGDYFEVANHLISIAYYLEEFDFSAAKQVYLKVIEYIEKSNHKLLREGNFEDLIKNNRKIAEIYKEKIGDSSKFEKYIKKCIEYSKNLLEISLDNTDFKMKAIGYINLGELFNLIEDWSNALKAFQVALEIAKKGDYYELISNSYLNISNIYLYQGDELNSFAILEEAFQYFKEQEKRLAEKNNYEYISDIYQILKKISLTKQDHIEFVKYSQKQAISYIEMAKKYKLNQSNSQKVARLYRAAALCYKDTDENDLESATCFLIAGNLFKELSNFGEASISYGDAAESFERAGYYSKACKLYIDAADLAIKINNYEFAIEKLIEGYEIIIQHELLDYKNTFITKIIKYLSEFSDIQASQKKFFTAGSLLLESLRYYKELEIPSNSPEIMDLLKKIYSYFYEEYESNKINEHNSTVLYILALCAIVKIPLKKYKEVQEIIDYLNSKNIEYAKIYANIIESMCKCFRSNTKFDIGSFDPKTKKVYTNSEEIKLFELFFFQ